MKKINSVLKRLLACTVFFLLVLHPLSVFSAKLDEGLIDDVTAMITNAKKLAHTTFLIDTSESMNTFAYSDYINTCDDAKRNIDHSIALCDSSYNQCRNVEANAMCGVNLGCADIMTRCNSLRASRVRLNQFCNDIYNIYSEPSKTVPYGADPMAPGNNPAKKFVGPWNPQLVYNLDLCFYNWTEDTGGDVLNNTNSGHYSNPAGTDRRDWDCLTDGVNPPADRSGLWLNWKYATSLDAVKIILANTHTFSYPPKWRGVRKCFKTKFYPVTEDAVLGNICYEEFDTNSPVPPTFLKDVGDNARTYWKKEKLEVADALCLPPQFLVTVDTDFEGYLTSIPAVAPTCDLCRNWKGEPVPCETLNSTPQPPAGKTVSGLTTTVNYSCCLNFECADPKCRDDDSSCRSAGVGGCVLGYYSDYDQDQWHCCNPLTCIEPDPGMLPGVCPSGGRYLPGPGNTNRIEFEESLVGALASPNEYLNVYLTATVKSLTFDIPKANVEKAVLTLYYGCDNAGEKPATKIVEKSYTTEVVDDAIVSVPFNFDGCKYDGYKVGGVLEVFHSGVSFSEATATMEIEFNLKHDTGSPGGIDVLDPSVVHYTQYEWEVTGAVGDVVSEYECKTTMYHKQSTVVNGGPGNCPPKHSGFDRCVYPDHTVIAADQWGSPRKTACSWLCRDKPVYDDPWKCRMFFSQMDTIQRNGPNLCADKCYEEGTYSLYDCCDCIHGASASYNYLNLETPEYVRFTAGGPLLQCSVSGFQEGIRSDGGRTFISGFMAEVVKGNIKEVPYNAATNPLNHNTYRLSDAGYISPYDLTEHIDMTNSFGSGVSIPDNARWYYKASMFGRNDQYLNNSFVSLFETGKNDRRDVACIYDLINNFEGEDCEDCLSTGCCTVDIGNEHEMCDYPSFWMKIPNTEGGNLRFPAQTLAGAEMNNFRNVVRTLKAKGGSTLGETLYDVWRYLGGMPPLHDSGYKGAPYPSPYQSADSACFMNDAVVISGGQPQFDDNSAVADPGFSSQSPGTIIPYVDPDPVDIPDSSTPYTTTNWYLTSFRNVAEFVKNRDFWHTTAACRQSADFNAFGYESNAGGPCTTGTDGSGRNYIDKLHAVAIGDWALAPLYNNPGNNYLDESVLAQGASVKGPDPLLNYGIYFGLTAQATSSTADYKTFQDLSSLFDAFIKEGSPADRAAGRPHWTSSAVQPFGVAERARGPEAYFPATIPIDNRTSRFWFGNLKKYYFDDAGPGCGYVDTTATPTAGAHTYTSVSIPPNDCFDGADVGADISDARFKTINAGGAASVLKTRLTAHPTSCTNDPESACYLDGARNILYDNNVALKELSSLTVGSADFNIVNNLFLSTKNPCTPGDTVQILDYIYGYDSYDDDGDGDFTNVRYTGALSTVTIDDPFNISFAGTSTTTIRPLLLGAITHSMPVAVYYGNSDTTRIFAGANDGMLHSFDQDGNETFAYIPFPVMPALTSIADYMEGIKFKSFVDGPVKLFHLDDNKDGIITDGEKAYIIFGYRRGAKYYTVIDISVLDDPKFVQHISVEGQSWAKPLIFNKGNTKYMVLAGGYDPCFDPDIPSGCSTNGSGHLEPDGNEVSILRYNDGTGKFDNFRKIEPDSNGATQRDTEWLRASIVADPIAINTSDTLDRETEFVYLIDISGTVFRIDVKSSDTALWTFRAVYKQRLNALDTNSWIGSANQVRTYNSFAIYPPTVKYPSELFAADPLSRRFPIPILTGNYVNPRHVGSNLMLVFYDKVDYPWADAPLMDTGANFRLVAGVNVYDPNVDKTKDGWKVLHNAADPNTGLVIEKGIRRPLIYYDRWEYNTYTLVWNTYLPSIWGECRGFGISYNYARNLWNGTRPQLGPYSDFDTVFWTAGRPISIATEVGVLATRAGEHIGFGAGDEIFLTKNPVTPPDNTTNIIKWYELY